MNLLVLPCTPKLGDYFSSPSWQRASHKLSEYRPNLKFCAVDCTQTFCPLPDPRGPLVLEEDISSRNKGIDVWPCDVLKGSATPEKGSPFEWSDSSTRPLYHHYHLLTNAMITAVTDVLPQYESIFVLLSSRLYRIAIVTAIHETLGFENVYVDNQPSAAFSSLQALERVKLQLETNVLLSGIWDFPKHGEYYPKFEENLHRWMSDPELPNRFKFFEWSNVFHVNQTHDSFKRRLLSCS